MAQSVLNALGLIVGILGLAVTIGFGVYSIWDAHNQRAKKDKALAIFRGPVHEARGAAITLKATLTDEKQINAIDDLISRIDKALKNAEDIS